MGVDRILFAIDWPFIDNKLGADWFENISISKEDKNDKIETKVDPMEVEKESLKQGMDALGGTPGTMRDCIAYCSAIISSHVSGNDVKTCYKEITKILDSVSDLSIFKKI